MRDIDDAETYERLQEVLRRLRRQADLTQRQLAEKLGVRQEWVSRYETGERRVDVVELARIAKGLNTTVAEIMRLAGIEG